MKKDTKKVTKVSKKKFEPKFTVDLTNVQEPRDIYAKFGLAKHNAGLPMTDDELEAIIDKVADYTRDLLYYKMLLNFIPVKIHDDEKITIDAKGNVEVKKPNIFKRFWNWIRRK